MSEFHNNMEESCSVRKSFGIINGTLRVCFSENVSSDRTSDLPYNNYRTTNFLKKSKMAPVTVCDKCRLQTRTWVSQTSPSVSQTRTSVSQTSTSVRQTSTPVSQTSNPVSQTSTSVSQTSTSIRQTSTPVSETSTSVRQTSTSVRQTSTSVRQTSNPVSQTSTSVRLFRLVISDGNGNTIYNLPVCKSAVCICRTTVPVKPKRVFNDHVQSQVKIMKITFSINPLLIKMHCLILVLKQIVHLRLITDCRQKFKVAAKMAATKVS